MKEVVLVYPNQLFEEHPALDKERTVYLVEDPIFFKKHPFHKKKLILHRASMKAYEQKLKKKGYRTKYIEGLKKSTDIKKEIRKARAHVVDVVDHELEKTLEGLNIRWYVNPGFFLSKTEAKQAFRKKSNLKMYSFYRKQRLKYEILVKNGKPEGGKWSYDVENRKKLPEGMKIPKRYTPKEGKHVKEARKYVEKKSPKSYGNSENFEYPINRKQALKALQDFIKNRYDKFGKYEDAIAKNRTYMFHSVLSSSINIGLLTPQEVVEAAVKAKAPLNSKEGFIRQILGWREFMRGVYEVHGERQRDSNFFKHRRKLPKEYWKAKTGIPPVDMALERVNKHAYTHHIERLMVLSNFMNLSEIKPGDVYEWFMTMFIDAYDWVMVPNVYGMGLHADGGLITTKPYISSSNYLKKMSNYKCDEWCEIWDGLYWHFIDKHKKYFKKNPRMAVMAKQVEKQKKKVRKGKEYLQA